MAGEFPKAVRCARFRPYEAGSTEVQELAFLRCRRQYVRALMTAGLMPEAACRAILFALQRRRRLSGRDGQAGPLAAWEPKIAEAFGAKGLRRAWLRASPRGAC
jgi:hypothetical protein